MELTLEDARRMMNQSGGSLDLRGTQIASLPEGLTIGGDLYLRGTGIKKEEIKKVKRLGDGDYVPNKYLYADGILTHVRCKKRVGDYTVFVGKIPHRHVVYDGRHYAHCKNLREGIADLLYTSASDRGADQYKGIPLDTQMTVPELVAMYRTITGACRAGSGQFVSSLKDLQERYTIKEAIELTKGQYGAEKFKDFFL